MLFVGIQALFKVYDNWRKLCNVAKNAHLNIWE